MALTNKQKRFVDEYLVDLNATQAAIRAGYSKKTANRTGSENLSKPVIKAAIEERMEEKKSELIADQDEVLEFLSAVFRGEEKETVVDGNGNAEDVPAAIKDRIRAAELVGKRYGIFSDNIKIDGDVPVVITDDIEE